MNLQNPSLRAILLLYLCIPLQGQTDSASANLRTVLTALRSDPASIRGAISEQKNSRRTYKAKIALVPESLDECTLTVYGKDPEHTYSCWWLNDSVDPLRDVFTRLVSALKSACEIEVSRDRKGSQISGKCGDRIEVESQFGKEKDGNYFIYVDLKQIAEN